jgi:hypothetical protein
LTPLSCMEVKQLEVGSELYQWDEVAQWWYTGTHFRNVCSKAV